MRKIYLLLVILSLSLLPVAAIAADWTDSVPSGRVLVDEDTRVDGQPVYIGWGPPNAAKDGHVWVIVKITYTDDGNFEDMILANGNRNPSKCWDDRAGYTYSGD